MTHNAKAGSPLPQMSIFRSALPIQVTLQEVDRVLGALDGRSCLNIGDEAGVCSAHLRSRGGDWATVVADEGQAVLARELVESNVFVMQDGHLPFPDKSFEVVLLLHTLESAPSDSDFVAECHRVLANDGRLVLVAGHTKHYTVIPALERMLGLSTERLGLARPGYSEPELFALLKDGFDVKHVRTFMRFWVKLVDTCVRATTGKPVAPERLARAVRTFKLAGAFYRIADQLDLLLFWTRGFSVVCEAKRRAWLPRKTPVLSDGRSISEAVLSRMAG